MEVDDALTLLGSYGRWQIVLFVNLSIFVMFASAFHTYGYLFQAYTPPHHCQVLHGAAVNTSIPWDDKQDAYSSCLVYVNISLGNQTMQCSEAVNEWDYFGESNDTIVSEWNLVCEREYLKKTTSSLFGFGILLGTAIFTPLHDLFGRRPFFLICQWLTVVIGVWNAFVYNYYVYFVVQFLLGVLRPAYGMAGFTLACELFSAKYRTFAGIIIEDFWGVGVCLLALFMYLIPFWRHLQLLISLFSLLSIPLFWFLPESIPWLVSKGKLDEAERVIQRAGRVNRITNMPASIFKPGHTNSKTKLETDDEMYETKTGAGYESLAEQQLEFTKSQDEIYETKDEPDYTSLNVKIEPDNGKFNQISAVQPEAGAHAVAVYTMLDVLKHPKLRRFLVVSSILWFVNSVVYYGMTLNTEELAGNRHLNLFLSGLVEIPSYTLSYFIINKWGRRFSLVIFHIFAGVFLIVSQVIPDKTAYGKSLQPLEITFTMMGKFCITASYGIVCLYASELFPTSVRSQSTGIAALSGRIGGMLAPFTSSLNRIEPWLTAVVFGIVSISGGLLALILPETNKRPLPQTIEDIEAWYKPVAQPDNPNP